LSLSEKTLLFDQRSFGLGLPTGLTTLRLCEILSGLGCDGCAGDHPDHLSQPTGHITRSRSRGTGA
jgi:hypothetical protein